MTLSRTRPAHPHIDALPPCHPRSSFIPSRPLPLRYCLCCDNTQSPAPGPAPRARVPPPPSSTCTQAKNGSHANSGSGHSRPSATHSPSPPAHCQDGSITNTAASVFSVAPAGLTMDRTSAPIPSDHDCLHCKHTQRIALETYILGSPIVCFHYTRFKRRGQTLYKDTAKAVPPRTLYGTTTRSYVLRSFIITFPLLQCPHSPFPPP